MSSDLGSVLRAEGLSREAGGRRLVDAVSLAVDAGQVLAVVGPSGAGKSSLLRLLNRLDEPSAGTVLLRGRDYRGLPPRELRRQVGMVLQSPFLFPGTVAQNLRFGPAQRGETLPEPELERLLERVGLAGYAARDVGRLSGGEAQRVSLARTLANRPDVLLLDEPTSALDERSRLEVERLVQGVIAERRLACLIVTHDMDQAVRIATHALRMERGRAVACGPLEEVL
jgi:putative ABC transport system ATP-binding protein